MLCRDDVDHRGNRLDWGKWAICSDDYQFGGTGGLKTGADYNPAPGTLVMVANTFTADSNSWQPQAFAASLHQQRELDMGILPGLS